MLGAPKTHIAVTIEQGDQRVVVTRGDAGNDYSFTTTVRVPSTLRPGAAAITTPGGDVPIELQITDAPPTHHTDGSVAAFDNPPATSVVAAAATTSTRGRTSRGAWWAIAAIGLVVVAGFATLVTRARRR